VGKVLRGTELEARAEELGVSRDDLYDADTGALDEPELQRRVLKAERARREARGLNPMRWARAGGHASRGPRGFLSSLATGLGLVGAALIAFVGASVFGLTGYFGSQTPLPAAAALLAPLMGLAGLVVALVSRWREGSDGWVGPLQVNCTVMVVAGLLLLLALL
jgi:hypothetical protein